MTEIKAPNWYRINLGAPILFLAGSIEMDTAERWQSAVVTALSNAPHLMILNPRRDDWDSNWVQSIDNPQFNKQVQWELDGLEDSDLVLFYFDPATKSPITMLELGLILGDSGSARDIFVVCPDGYHRKGNVDIICKRYGARQFPTLDLAIAAIREELS